MSQEPWNEEVYHTSVSRRDRISQSLASTKIFTILAIIFFIIVLVIAIAAIYLSTGGSKTDSTHEFYNSKNAPVVSSEPVVESSSEVEESTEATEELETETSSSSSSSLTDNGDGTTLTVQPGEGLGQLASRGGISIAELERLNPEKMATGSWLAHPGDVVRIR